jgi:predicted nuclease of predicted toxin-antitoxin system
MKFLANENIPRSAVKALRDAGNDVVWVREDASGMLDPDVLAWAEREQRLLLTFDKDFGQIAFNARLPATCGIVLFRLSMPLPSTVGAAIAALVMSRNDWAGRYSVVQNDRIRMRDLPSIIS